MVIFLLIFKREKTAILQILSLGTGTSINAIYFLSGADKLFSFEVNNMTKFSRYKTLGKIKIPPPDNSLIVFYGVLILVMVIVCERALENLLNYKIRGYIELSASILFLAFSSIIVLGALGDWISELRKIPERLCDALSIFPSSHFLAVIEKSDKKELQLYFWLLYVVKLTRRKIPLENIELISCSSGQATSRAHRDMDDWSVFIREKGACHDVGGFYTKTNGTKLLEDLIELLESLGIKFESKNRGFILSDLTSIRESYTKTLSTISDFVELEREGFSPRQQWDTLLRSPILLEQLDGEPKNITKYVSGWDKKLKFIELTKSENYSITIVHLGSIVGEHSNPKGEFAMWLQDNVPISKDRHGIILFEMKDLLYLNSCSMGALVHLYDLCEKEGIAFLMTQLDPELDKVFKVLGLYKLFSFVGDRNKFLKKVYYQEINEIYFESRCNMQDLEHNNNF